MDLEPTDHPVLLYMSMLARSNLVAIAYMYVMYKKNHSAPFGTI